jgi:hypothetical protein
VGFVDNDDSRSLTESIHVFLLEFLAFSLCSGVEFLDTRHDHPALERIRIRLAPEPADGERLTNSVAAVT